MLFTKSEQPHQPDWRAEASLLEANWASWQRDERVRLYLQYVVVHVDPRQCSTVYPTCR